MTESLIEIDGVEWCPAHNDYAEKDAYRGGCHHAWLNRLGARECVLVPLFIKAKP